MDEPSLTGVMAKLNRAEEHLSLLELEICSFLHREPPPIAPSTPYFDGDDGWHLVYAIVDELPDIRMGITLGDFIHQIRSILDHLVWQLVLLAGNRPKRCNAFPVCDTPTRWNEALGRELQGITDKGHLAIIEQVQPYHAGNGDQNTLAALNFLSRVDKHQVVHSMLVALDNPIGAVSFRIASGPGSITKQEFCGGITFEHKAEIFRCRIEGFAPETQVEIEGDIPVEVAFSKRLIRWEGICQFLQFARLLIQEFEPAFSKNASSTQRA